MGIGNTVGKIEKIVIDNATILSFFGSALARAGEANPADPIGELISMLNPIGTSYGPIYEIMHNLNFAGLKYKLIDSPHAATTLFKIGIGAWIASELGVIPAKYGSLGKKVATGAGIAALITPGSGPNENKSSIQENFRSAPVMQMAQAYY
jgi:hypothetical protein